MLILLLLASFLANAQTTVRPPLMGWVSWNNYRVGTDGETIKAQVSGMAENGMKYYETIAKQKK